MIVRRLVAFMFCLFAPTSVLASDGVKAQILSVKLTPDRRPVVTLKVSDANGNALEASDLDHEGFKFTIAAVNTNETGETHYHNYILSKVAGKRYLYKGETKNPALSETLQPDFDRGGVLARVRAGVFTYTFKTALPLDYDRKATHVIGSEITRHHGKYVANPLYEFVPSGGKVRIRRAVSVWTIANLDPTSRRERTSDPADHERLRWLPHQGTRKASHGYNDRIERA